MKVKKLTSCNLSEARQRLGRLVDQVATGGSPVAIHQRDKERVVIVSAEWFHRIAQPANAQPRLAHLRGIAQVPDDLEVEPALRELDQSIRRRLEAKAREILS
jgi:prevent-host-death family protein